MRDSEKAFYVYEHREADTGRTFYVGKGKGRRAFGRTSRNRHWKSVVRKHGFVAHIIFDRLSEHDALRLEMELIEAYGMEQLAVFTSGGAGTAGFTHSDETKKRMSEARKGRKLSDTARQRLSEAVRSSPVEMKRRRDKWLGIENPSHSLHVRKMHSERMKEKNPSHDPEVVKRVADMLRGRSLSEEHKAALKVSARRGEDHPNFGKPRQIETVSKMRESQRYRMKAVRTACGLVFESTKAAAIATGARQGNIVNCCRGRAGSAGGYIWQYVEP